MTAPCDIEKRREIVFHPLPPGQLERALTFLAQVPRLTVSTPATRTLLVQYCVADHTLQDLENALLAQGFHIENTLLIRIKRALIYYTERVQLENMDHPEVRTKNYQAHVEAWDKRPHGDRDETPVEWRQYK